MQHVEFFHNDHFEDDYFRVKPSKNLKKFIDFFWETDFDHLYDLYPQGFSDALFPNIGYTYLINLGTPFIMQLGDAPFHVKTDGFLPRHQNIECHHSSGNKIFGIKFKVSPVLFQKKVDFSEYKEYIFPLAYLIDRHVVEKVKRAADFQSRVAIITEYYEKILQEYSGTTKHVDIVASILNDCFEKNNFDISIEDHRGTWDKQPEPAALFRSYNKPQQQKSIADYEDPEGGCRADLRSCEIQLCELWLL